MRRVLVRHWAFQLVGLIVDFVKAGLAVTVSVFCTNDCFLGINPRFSRASGIIRARTSCRR